MNGVTVFAVYVLSALLLLTSELPWLLAPFMAAAVTPGILVVWLSLAAAVVPNGRGKHGKFLVLTSRVLLDGGGTGRRRKPKGWL